MLSWPNLNHKRFISSESNIEKLVGVATLPPFLIPVLCNIGILLHKQGNRPAIMNLTVYSGVIKKKSVGRKVLRNWLFHSGFWTRGSEHWISHLKNTYHILPMNLLVILLHLCLSHYHQRRTIQPYFFILSWCCSWWIGFCFDSEGIWYRY